MKTINNDYDSIAHSWWSEDLGDTASLRYLINPPRFNYFRKIINDYAEKLKTLDIGCGGGLLAEELAKLGLSVTGVDISKESICVAQDHAVRNGLNITYLESPGEHLPFADASFDLVFCCDVLEHVSNVSNLILEVSRVLKKGGLFFFDTINRTIQSKLGIIFLMQKFKLTAIVRSDVHVWDMFITPDELKTVLSRHGIEIKDMKGLVPMNHGISIITGFYKAARKKISYRELADRLNFSESEILDGSYMGYGTKLRD